MSAFLYPLEPKSVNRVAILDAAQESPRGWRGDVRPSARPALDQTSHFVAASSIKPVRIAAASRNKTGFTLIELLVVISIIIILITLIVPNTTRVRENARRAKCLNNLRVIATCMALYADDNGGAYPASSLGELYDERYCPELETFNCPSTPNQPTGTLGNGTTPGVVSSSDYAYHLGQNDSFGGQNALVADRPVVGAGSANHTDPNGTEAGRNVMFASGSVRWVPQQNLNNTNTPNLSNVTNVD